MLARVLPQCAPDHASQTRSGAWSSTRRLLRGAGEPHTLSHAGAPSNRQTHPTYERGRVDTTGQFVEVLA